MKNIVIKQINKYFNYVKIATLQQIKKKLNTTISKTVQRYLKKFEYFTSYSHNGEYYTHKRFANFDKNGLWTYKSVHFSTYGKLTDTIENFVNHSESGYNSIELQKILHVKVSDTLLQLTKNKKIIRKKLNCKFYYFSNVPAIQKAQLLLCRSIVEKKFGDEMNKEKISDTEIKRGFALFFNQLDEKQKRLFSGLESALLGYGGDKIIAETFGLDPHTVSRGRQEILSGDFEKKNIRKQGAGRKPIKKKSPKIIDKIENIIKYELAGDPITGLLWTKKSSRKIASELETSYNIGICANTVCSLLKENGYSLQINHKKIEINRILTAEEKYLRNQQFLYIEKQRRFFSKHKFIIISVDAKKKEYIGNFINKGSCWVKNQKGVYAYDYPSWASGVAIPFGVYDILHNYGFVNVGTSYNTGEFAVNSIKKYYETFGSKFYKNNKKILILADSGGSNGCRLKLWKYELQKEICNRFGIEVTVAHYPTGTSKYNAIEHKLFCHISNNWAGNPLINYETMLNYISTTTTEKGLSASAVLDKNEYELGIKITKKQMNDVNIEFYDKIPKWNYTIYPN